LALTRQATHVAVRGYRSPGIGGAAVFLLGAVVASPGLAAGGADPRLIEVAQEARQTIAVIDWFYVQHRACPQPSRPAELESLQRGLGDGFTVDREGQFVAIRGISMRSVWLYYASHPSGEMHAVAQARLGPGTDLAPPSRRRTTAV
jgi:hypothetical protein